MSGYSHNYGGYGAPPSSAPTYGGPTSSTGYGESPPSSVPAYAGHTPSTGYGGAPPPSSAPTYGAPTTSTGYGAPPPSSGQSYGGPPPNSTQHYGSSDYSPPSSAQSYGGPPPSAPQSYGSSAPYGGTTYSGYSSDPIKPPKDNKPSAPYAFSDPYSAPPPLGQYQHSSYSSDPVKPPPPSYGGPPPSTTQYHGSHYAPVASPYSGYSSDPVKPPKDNKPSAPYGGSYSSPPYGVPPPSAGYGGGGGASPFGGLVPSRFPPGIDPNIVACFQIADQDGSGFIDDIELQRALSTYNDRFSLRTVRLLMYHFTNTNAGKIGPKEFTDLFHSLQKWRAIFDRFDRDRSGKIDVNELREALLSQGFAVPPPVLELLVSKYDKNSGKTKAMDYENFLECCLTVKGLTEKFKEKDVGYTGSATFTYESFMLTVLPFLIA